jgi:hypothetical protein
MSSGAEAHAIENTLPNGLKPVTYTLMPAS